MARRTAGSLSLQQYRYPCQGSPCCFSMLCNPKSIQYGIRMAGCRYNTYTRIYDMSPPYSVVNEKLNIAYPVSAFEFCPGTHHRWSYMAFSPLYALDNTSCLCVRVHLWVCACEREVTGSHSTGVKLFIRRAVGGTLHQTAHLTYMIRPAM